MPPKRSISSSSATSFKRNVPFKPPGPAKGSKSPSTTGQSSSTLRRTSSLTAAIKGKGPEVLRPSSPSSSDTGDDDEEDFGTTIDLEDDLVLPDVNTTAVNRMNAVSAPGAIRSEPTIIDSEPEMTSDLNISPGPVQTANTAVTNQTQGQTAYDAEEVPELPPALLARLVHENFDDKEMRMSKPANEVLRRYMNVFMREAVARAAEGKKERLGLGTGGTDADEEVWLDVEDLERITGGLLLDF